MGRPCKIVMVVMGENARIYEELKAVKIVKLFPHFLGC